MSDYPAEFNDVIRQLETLSDSGSAIYARVAQLKANLKTSLDSLNDISSRTASISDLINRLKASLAELERKNEDLERMLREGRTNFEREMTELQERQGRELVEERQRLAAEKEELQRRFAESAQMSQAERESSIREAAEAADKRAREQTEAIQRAHEEERAKLVAQYQKDYNGLLGALTRIAESQARAIGQINGELDESEQLTTEFATVQKQILGLLASISQILTDERVQGQGSPPPSFERQQILPAGSPSEELELKNLAPAFDLDDLENLEDLKNSTRNSDKFEYMMKILNLRYKNLNQEQKDNYDYQIKSPFERWVQYSSNPEGITNQQFLDQKSQVYQNVKSFFNSTSEIEPVTEKMELQVGGRRTRRHRRRVHFKTKAKKGGKGGKKGGKKGVRKSRKGGKRTGGKRTRKH